MMKKRIRLTLYGRVQGVFFRRWSQQQAVELSLSGFAKNQNNGTLIIEVQGMDENLKEFALRCEEGPELAVLTDITNNEIDLVDNGEFQIA